MTDAAYKVILTRAAHADLRAIHAYMAEVRSVEAADELLSQLNERVLALRNYPLRGSIPQELEASGTKECRQIVHPPYRLLYSVVDDIVLILMIADGRRDMQALLSQRLLGQ